MNKYKKLYQQITKMLIYNQLLTQDESDTIARIGTRKESYWARHLLDMCQFVLEHREPNEKIKMLLNKILELVKST